MPIIDPHVDIASIYDEYNIPLEDFFSNRRDVPVTLSLIEQNDIKVVGMTLFMDPNLVKTTMFDGVMDYYNFYKSILTKTKELSQIRTSADLASLGDKTSFFYSIEGFECIRDIEDFEFFFNEVGVRSFGLTWEPANEYASGNGADTDTGITIRGKELLKHMNSYKLILDSAHLGQVSFADLGESFEGTIVNTHACARTVNPLSSHNLTDQQIDLIVEHKGIICLLPSKEEAGGNGSFDDLYRHVDYIASKWGIEYVGLCSDIFPSELAFIDDIQDVSIIRVFRDYLLARMSKEEVEKIAYRNFLNVLERSI